jgi:small conductance mechanosensitive channel
MCLFLMFCSVLLLPVTATHAQQEQAASPAYSTLADLLENEQTRKALIEDLRVLASKQTQVTEPGQALPVQEPEKLSLPRRMAEMVSGVAGEAGSRFQRIVSNLRGILTAKPGTERAIDMQEVTRAALNLGLLIIAVVAAFFIFRRLVRPVFSRLSHWYEHGGGKSSLLRAAVAVILAALVDALVVVLAYVSGNIIATFAIGEAGALSTRFALFLNAFLMIELLKAGIRMLFSSSYDSFRLLPISAEEAEYWNRFLARLTGFLGYGLLLVVPLVNAYLSYALGQGVNLIIMLLAFVYATTVVLKNRVKIQEAIKAKADKAALGTSQALLRILSHIWHVLTIAYFLVVLVITLARPADALPFVMLATLKTLIFIGLGLLASGILSQLIGRKIKLSPDISRKVPLLESRLNSYVPMSLKVIRVVILIAVVMLTFHAWGIFDLPAWYASQSGRGLVGKLVSVAIILVMALGVWVLLASVIEHRLNPETGTGEPTARAKTLLSLFRNALAIALATITFMIVLSEIGINIGPLIAGAGVLGLAIGFGSQKLVQDIITGVFIQVENAMNAGDVVTAGGITGVAERLSIRSVGLRDLSGVYHLIPFSSVDTVSNFMRDFSYHVGVYGIAYREDIDEAISHLRAAFDELCTDQEHKDNILEPLEVHGVTALGNSSVDLRIRIKTKPGTQWAIGRAYNRLVKRHFDAAGIEIPFPHTTLYFGQDKDGSAPPAHLRMLNSRPGEDEEIQEK